ncbi:MAG: hypothetical protein J5I94_04115 [Phaeodactylibacter sp.]|nr:hypothetical protein [Phaeodactylibacter sp.]
MDGITILLIVLSSILLILILGLIFNKEFRKDILLTDSQNEVGIKGISLKGSLFWVLYAATAGGAIYLGLQHQPGENGQAFFPTPQLASAIDFVAIDLEKAEPAGLKISCKGCDTLDIGNKPPNLGLDLTVDSKFDIRSRKSNYLFGRLDEASIKALSGFKELALKNYIEVKYNITLSPFRSDRDFSPQYNWAEYNTLPFIVEVRWTQNDNTFALIRPEESAGWEERKKGLDNKWSEVIRMDNDIYVVKLRASDLQPEGTPEFANFVILEFEGR